MLTHCSSSHTYKICCYGDNFSMGNIDSLNASWLNMVSYALAAQFAITYKTQILVSKLP